MLANPAQEMTREIGGILPCCGLIYDGDFLRAMDNSKAEAGGTVTGSQLLKGKHFTLYDSGNPISPTIET